MSCSGEETVHAQWRHRQSTQGGVGLVASSARVVPQEMWVGENLVLDCSWRGAEPCHLTTRVRRTCCRNLCHSCLWHPCRTCPCFCLSRPCLWQECLWDMLLRRRVLNGQLMNQMLYFLLASPLKSALEVLSEWYGRDLQSPSRRSVTPGRFRNCAQCSESWHVSQMASWIHTWNSRARFSAALQYGTHTLRSFSKLALATSFPSISHSMRKVSSEKSSAKRSDQVSFVRSPDR